MTRFTLCLFVFIYQNASAFSWEEFIPLALKKSPEVEQVRNRYEVTNLSLILAERNLDWNVTLQSGVERDRREAVTSQVFDLEKSQTNNLNLKKSLLTGTDISLDAFTEDIRFRSPTLVGESKLQSNSYFLTLEQNLWRNSFGSGIRAQVNAAKKENEALNLEKKETLESTLLRGGQLFWQAATAARKYEESENILKRYAALVKNVEQKNRVRYTTPGEYAQVQAEYFNRQRETRINKIAFEQAVRDLTVFLPDLGAADLKWNNAAPSIGDITEAAPELNQTRAYKLAELKKDQAKLNAESAESYNRSQLALVGQVGATGIDSSATEAQKEWIEGRRPSLYMGVKWSHNFGSGSQDAQIRQARAQARAQEIGTELDKQRLIVKADILKQEVAVLEENLKSQEKELQAFRRAVQELTRHYNQGRIDISVLIDVMNKGEEAEADQVELRGDLELKILEWRFLYDKINVE